MKGKGKQTKRCFQISATLIRYVDHSFLVRINNTVCGNAIAAECSWRFRTLQYIRRPTVGVSCWTFRRRGQILLSSFGSLVHWYFGVHHNCFGYQLDNSCLCSTREWTLRSFKVTVSTVWIEISVETFDRSPCSFVVLCSIKFHENLAVHTTTNRAKNWQRLRYLFWCEKWYGKVRWNWKIKVRSA